MADFIISDCGRKNTYTSLGLTANEQVVDEHQWATGSVPEVSEFCQKKILALTVAFLGRQIQAKGLLKKSKSDSDRYRFENGGVEVWARVPWLAALYSKRHQRNGGAEGES